MTIFKLSQYIKFWFGEYSKTFVIQPLSKRQKIGFQDQGSILQYF